ncbi:phosphoribosyltransferase domain-containing protein [Klebsiella pneumoniae]|uniref:phosphoribosyltransferase domain-containing protein n=1 Tax=Klebsiella TaxID=570 RepID=UPI0018C4F61E|nr:MULTISPECIES: phosphoribosyltransferase domain-containing protein [Klebsiella]HCC2748918.1 phosphoribosyltransferase domain-containing protein [Klebsiella quasipneumoniae]HDT5900863.1 phosphoribosyltransferase domain-containing protein [Raoultella ornithinolytica]MBD7346210.1 phosphoribosyltransferase domain-containing protein [Klebsiella pneumoniae]MBD7356801.1 phosphoribosyltransferase domain-containing protein [Klebsiella pneumoniae]MBD7367432.1 phosphoribosyltransferase domain-containin
MSVMENDFVYQKTLSCGRIEVSSDTSGYPLSDLFDIAERRNPKRAFLFVSKVLGRHIPVSPGVMRGVYTQLAEQFLDVLDGPVVFIGMAETAVGLGAGVFDEVRKHRADCVYLTSTRHPVDGELLCEFKEEHSHATDHLIYHPSTPEMRRTVAEAQTLVLVDDEATTGKTFLNLLASLRASDALPQVRQVIAVTLTDWSGEALSKESPLPIHAVSLISGHWRWTPDPDAPLPVMPPVNVTCRGNIPVTGKQSWGRVGMQTPASDLGLQVKVSHGENILVLGTCEFVWEPFLLAERLETAGAQVLYSSTTRSPISTGYAIQSAISFSDNYGLGIPNFVYNVAHQRFDRILLCTETPASSVDPRLLEALSAVAPAVEVITYE